MDIKELLRPCVLSELSPKEKYAKKWSRGRYDLHHRVVWEEAHQAWIIPGRGNHVRHLCGVSRCVEPTHLVLGSRKENEADKLVHGTRPQKDTHPLAKLSSEQVGQIRFLLALSYSQSELARAYGLSQHAVWAIAHNKTWRS